MCQEFVKKIVFWFVVDFENVLIVEGKLVVYVMWLYVQWDVLLQFKVISNFFIDVNFFVGFSDYLQEVGFFIWMLFGDFQCLKGLKVVEMSCVIVVLFCGKIFVVYGVDVIWVILFNFFEFFIMD